MSTKKKLSTGATSAYAGSLQGPRQRTASCGDGHQDLGLRLVPGREGDQQVVPRGDQALGPGAVTNLWSGAIVRQETWAGYNDMI